MAARFNLPSTLVTALSGFEFEGKTIWRISEGREHVKVELTFRLKSACKNRIQKQKHQTNLVRSHHDREFSRNNREFVKNNREIRPPAVETILMPNRPKLQYQRPAQKHDSTESIQECTDNNPHELQRYGETPAHNVNLELSQIREIQPPTIETIYMPNRAKLQYKRPILIPETAEIQAQSDQESSLNDWESCQSDWESCHSDWESCHSDWESCQKDQESSLNDRRVPPPSMHQTTASATCSSIRHC